jgi:hypothetical protein
MERRRKQFKSQADRADRFVACAPLHKRITFVACNDARTLRFVRLLLAGHTRTPPRFETIVVEHPRLRIHEAAAFLRGDADGRRIGFGLRGRPCRPPQH